MRDMVAERSLEELHTISPQLASFVQLGGSLVAAYDGAGGVFAVYQPTSGRSVIDVAPPYFICTMRQRPTLVEVEGSTPNWHSRDFATRVACALASEAIRATPNTGMLAVSEDDADTVCGA